MDTDEAPSRHEAATPRGAEIDAFLHSRLDAYIAEVADLCAQPSVSARGEGMHECAALVADVLRRRGLEVQTVPTAGNPIVVGRARGRTERTLLFYNHYDVQPPEPLELWTSPPFQPVLRDGALYARGAKDDKGEFIARVAAVEAVRAAYDGTLPCGVLFVVEGEEEIGSPHIAEFVRAHEQMLRCHGAVWEEGGLAASGRPEISLGRRGILSVEIEARTISRDAHSGAAHILPNAAWRLHRALATLKDEQERILIEGFYDRVQPPSTRDLELLAALPDEEAWFREHYGVAAFVGGRTGAALAAAVFEPTCNIAGLTAGYQGPGSKTVIPARAAAKVDFRLVPDQDPNDIFDKLRAHLDRRGFSDVVLRRLGAMWPERVPVDDPLVHLAARTAEEVYGVPCQIRPLGGGSSPVYAFSKPLGIPVVTAGVGYAGNRTHAPDEHVRLGDFLNAARHIARILEGFATL
jgi:acetylornithine deacetylase/succinyl-diaminopimelate desuccinylase-like protein